MPLEDYPDLPNLDVEELGQMRRFEISRPSPFLDRILAIREEMAGRGYWYCDHCDHVTPLPNCDVCARSEVSQSGGIAEEDDPT